MGIKCEKCGKVLRDRTNRFCPYHELIVRKRMERDHYLTGWPGPTRRSDEPKTRGRRLNGE